MIETTNHLLPLDQRPTELGRIRLGEKNDRGLPTKIETWRLTSGSRAYLEAAAALYGGTVEAWTDAPDEGMWELLTDSRELDVLIPRDLRTLSQWYEWWQGGTCERRCDGTTEQFTGDPCLCTATGEMLCRPRTRLNIMLHKVPGLGVWRLETDGWNAATSLPATIELLKALSTQPWIPAVLRLEQRSKKTRTDEGKVQTHRFAVPVLDLPGITVGKVVARMGTAPEPARIEAVAPSTPTAAERVAQQRAAIEARTTSGAAGAALGGSEADHPGLEPPSADVRPVIPEATPGSAEAGTSGDDPGTMPAPSADPGATPLASGSAVQRCEGFHAEHGACRSEAGHPGNHQNADKESWR